MSPGALPNERSLNVNGSAAQRAFLQADWSVHEVVDFLGRCSQKLGVKTGEYQRLVQDNDIDGEVLRDLEDDDLQRLGIKSFGHRWVWCECHALSLPLDWFSTFDPLVSCRSFIAKLIKHYNPGMVGQDKRLYGSKSSDQASQSDTSVAESKTSAICPSNYMAPVAVSEDLRPPCVRRPSLSQAWSQGRSRG
jgi:hypothetical protein